MKPLLVSRCYRVSEREATRNVSKQQVSSRRGSTAAAFEYAPRATVFDEVIASTKERKMWSSIGFAETTERRTGNAQFPGCARVEKMKVSRAILSLHSCQAMNRDLEMLRPRPCSVCAKNIVQRLS